MNEEKDRQKSQTTLAVLLILYPLAAAIIVSILSYVLFYINLTDHAFDGIMTILGIISIGAIPFGVTFALFFIIGIIRYKRKSYKLNSVLIILSGLVLTLPLVIYFMSSEYMSYSMGAKKAIDDTLINSVTSIDQEKMAKLKILQPYEEPCVMEDKVRIAHDIWVLTDRELINRGHKDLVMLITMDLKSSYLGCTYTIRYVDNPDSVIKIMPAKDYVNSSGYSLKEIIDMNADEIIRFFNNQDISN